MQCDKTGYCLMASTSIEIATSSPTITPPASSALFHVKPKSLRLIFVVAEAPAWVLPPIETGAPDDSTSSTTGLVMPCNVRSPVTFPFVGTVGFDLCGFERDGRVLGDVEKVGTLQMHVAPLNPRVD
jgi:hypothetical protein